jgi:hypothetical protein
MTDSEKTLIGTLVSIRAARFSVSSIHKLAEADYTKMKALVIKLGEKILKANHADAELYNAAKINFMISINELFKKGVKFILVSYASQLLQYYTIISDAKFEPQKGTKAFLDLLADVKFGTTDNNLFVTEYKLIKIYNDLCDLVDSENGVIAQITTLAAQIHYLLEELKKIQLYVTKWVDDAPDNVFVHYLNFAVNYCFAKAIELQFTRLKHSLTEDEQSSLSDLQQTFLEQAQKALSTIKKLKENGLPLMMGSEFNLGQEVFNRLPVTDLEAVESHLNSLIKP